jgi:hypothetical protein
VSAAAASAADFWKTVDCESSFLDLRGAASGGGGADGGGGVGRRVGGAGFGASGRALRLAEDVPAEVAGDGGGGAAAARRAARFGRCGAADISS